MAKYKYHLEKQTWQNVALYWVLSDVWTPAAAKLHAHYGKTQACLYHEQRENGDDKETGACGGTKERNLSEE